MALTAWEALKVVGGVVEDMGIKGEAYEDENPGEKYTPSKGEVVETVVTVLQRIGVEVLD